MKVNALCFGEVTALRYEYDISDDGGFSLYLLCEVGEPWQAEAKAMAEALATERGCTIQQVELDYAPWYVDALVLV